MRFLFVYADNPLEWNSSEWRCLMPARAINRTGRHSANLVYIGEFVENPPDVHALCDSADVIVVERNLVGPVLAAINYWKARGKVVLANFDDAYDLVPVDNPAYGYWMRGESKNLQGQARQTIDPLPIEQFKWGLRLVDGAVVPSRRLAADWQAHTSVHYLPNYPETWRYTDVLPVPHDGVAIGWGGSATHWQSFAESGVIEALRRVCAARPQVRVVICGNNRKILDMIPVPDAQKVLRPWVSYLEWPQVLAHFDIGLAPLAGAYDDRRSWIKVLEYMLMKIPWVASSSHAYAELQPYGWLVDNTPGSWERVLLDMVDHLADYRREAGRDPYLFGIAQGIDENIEQWISCCQRYL